MTHNIKKVNDKRWIVEVEIDPESGEYMMPFSPEMLSQAGWDFGDTLEWNIDPQTHEVTIQKKV